MRKEKQRELIDWYTAAWGLRRALEQADELRRAWEVIPGWNVTGWVAPAPMKKSLLVRLSVTVPASEFQLAEHVLSEATSEYISWIGTSRFMRDLARAWRKRSVWEILGISDTVKRFPVERNTSYNHRDVTAFVQVAGNNPIPLDVLAAFTQ